MSRNFFWSLGILVLLGGCANDPREVPDTPVPVKLEYLSFSCGELEPPFDPSIKAYSISSINSLSDVTVTVKGVSEKVSLKINSIDLVKESTTLRFDKGKDILITVSYRDSSAVYKVSWLPPNFPAYTIGQSTATSAAPVCFAQLQSGLSFCYATAIDDTGTPVFYKKINSSLLSDFKKVITKKGATRYTYHVLDPNAPPVLGGFRGARIILDEQFNELAVVNSLMISVGQSEPPENHDFILIDDNHYIVSSYLLRPQVDLTAYGGGEKVDLVEVLIQEVMNNQVIFEWRSRDFPEFLLNSDDLYKSKYSGPGPVDYFHFNSICIDPIDDNLILSARHTNQVYKINRTTGQIMWRFGGKSDEFGLPANLKFSHQHHVTRLSNGNLLLFDNGNTNIPAQTRVFEFQINENLRTATLVWQYQEAGRFSSFMGSAQRLSNGNTLIGWGGSPGGTAQPGRSDITEVDPQGNVVFDLSFRNQPIDQFSYRAFRFE